MGIFLLYEKYLKELNLKNLKSIFNNFVRQIIFIFSPKCTFNFIYSKIFLSYYVIILYVRKILKEEKIEVNFILIKIKYKMIDIEINNIIMMKVI